MCSHCRNYRATLRAINNYLELLQLSLAGETKQVSQDALAGSMLVLMFACYEDLHSVSPLPNIQSLAGLVIKYIQ